MILEIVISVLLFLIILSSFHSVSINFLKGGSRYLLFSSSLILSFTSTGLSFIIKTLYWQQTTNLVILLTVTGNFIFSVMQVAIFWSYFHRTHRIKRIVFLIAKTFSLGIYSAGLLYVLLDGMNITILSLMDNFPSLSPELTILLSVTLFLVSAYILVVNDVQRRLQTDKKLKNKTNVLFITAESLYPLTVGIYLVSSTLFFYGLAQCAIIIFTYTVICLLILSSLSIDPRILMVEYLETESALEGKHPRLFINFALYYFSTLGPTPLFSWFPKYHLQGKELRDFLLEIGIKGMNFISLRSEEGATYLRIELDKPFPSSILFLGSLGTIEDGDKLIVDERFESRPYIALCLVGSPHFDWLFNHSSEWLHFFKKELENYPLEELTMDITKEKIKNIFSNLIK